MCRHTPGLFRHKTRKHFFFGTWVDDFIIKSNPATTDLAHFIDTLSLKYPIKFENVASAYISYRIVLYRHPTNHSLDTLTIDMRGYVTAALSVLDFTPTYNPGSPIIYIAPVYGLTLPQTEEIDNTPRATPEQQSFLRSAVGMFLYYALAIDCTLLLTLSKLAAQQSAPTTNTMVMLDRFLNYIAHHPDATITYRPSNMQLHVHSDELYPSDPLSRFRCSSLSTYGPIVFTGPNNPSFVNSPIRTTSSIITSVVGPATEASYATLFMIAQDVEVDQ
jgi:hypothetical protein